MKKLGFPASCIFLCMNLLLSCKSESGEGSFANRPCDSTIIDALLKMPILPSDSANILRFERELGSRSGIPQRQFVILPKLKSQFQSSDTLYGNMMYLIFPFRFVERPPWGFLYEPTGKIGSPYSGYSHLFLSNNAEIARKEPYWLPVFRRPSPIPWLQIAVAHEMLDSVASSFHWHKVRGMSMMKIYHRDAILDTVFPAPRPSDSFDTAAFRNLFECIQQHFDARYPLRYPKEPVVRYNYEDEVHFGDKPFRDLIRHHAWLRPDSVMVELYCFPADHVDKYYWWGGERHLLFDIASCTYTEAPQGTPGSVASAWDIRWEDLAIWLVYTDVSEIRRFLKSEREYIESISR